MPSLRKTKRSDGTEPRAKEVGSLFGVPIKTVEWMPDNTGVFIYNGVDNIVRLDGTDKEARYEIKKPQMVIMHTGEMLTLRGLKKWWAYLRKPDPKAQASPNLTQRKGI